MEVLNVLVGVMLTIIAIALLLSLLALSSVNNGASEDDYTPEEKENLMKSIKSSNEVNIKDYDLSQHRPKDDFVSVNDICDDGNTNNETKKDFSEFIGENVGKQPYEDKSETKDENNCVDELYSDDPINKEDLDWINKK